MTKNTSQHYSNLDFRDTFKYLMLSHAEKAEKWATNENGIRRLRQP